MSEQISLVEVNCRFRDFLGSVSLGVGTVASHIDRGDPIFLGRSYGRNNALLAWSDRPYQVAIDEVEKACPQVSRKTIADAVMSSMIKLFEEQAVREDAGPEAEAHLNSIRSILDEEAICNEVCQLVESLRSRIRPITVLLQMKGAVLKVPRLELGDAVLYPMECGPWHDVVKKLQDRGHVTPGHAQYMHERKDFYATIEMQGDQEYARLQASAKAQEIAHVLNLCFTACCRPLHTCQAVGIAGDPIRSGQTILFCDGQGGVGTYEAAAPWTRYEIDEEQVARWKRKGLDDVVECFNDEATTTVLKQRVRRAVTWYGRAAQAASTDEQFVDLTTVLDILLIGSEERGGIGERLAERIAFLFVDDYKGRLRCHDLVIELYRMRSKALHEGGSVSLENVHRLNDIVVASIWSFVGQKFSRWDDFLDWVRQRKYTSSVTRTKTSS